MISGVIRLAIFLQAMMMVWPAFGQNLKFETYLVEDGMSNNSVNRLAKDPTGSIWIGTWNGLNYFDGDSFLAYHHDPSQPNSLPGNYIHGVQVDHKGRVWVWAAPEAVSVFQPDSTFVNHTLPGRIYQFVLDKGGEIVLLADDVYYGYDEINDRFVPREGQPKDWFPQPIDIPDELEGIEFWKVIRDKVGNTWYASKSEGLFFQPYHAQVGVDKVEQYKSDHFYGYALKSNEVTDLLEDDFGNIWLGLKDGGIARAIKGSRPIHHLTSHPTLHPDLPNESIRAILEDSDGTLWIGFYNSGVYTRKAGQKEFKKYQVKSSRWTPEWDRIRSLFQDQHGQVWIGSYGGVIISNFRGGGQLLLDESSETGLGRVYGFAEDPAGTKVWLGSWNGVTSFNQETGELEDFEGKEQLIGLQIRHLFVDGQTLYISTENMGLAIFEQGKVRFLNASNGLLDNSVYTVFKEATSDRVWIGTHSGLSIWNVNTNQLTNLTKANGLQSNFVYGILGHGNSMWVSTARGIAKINRGDLEITSFDPTEGWQSAEFSQGASYKSATGQLYFGGVNGLNSFHPNDLEQTPNIPKLYVRQIKQGNESPYSASFQVDAVGFGVNSTNQIQYRLLPGQESWKQVEPSGLIQLQALKAGVYQLEVRNSLASQLSPEELEFQIEVPWYHDPRIYFILVLTMIGAVSLWKYRSSRQLQRRLERKIQERTHVILEQKRKLECANSDLEKKNQEIQNQKDKLLILHSKLQNSNFEVDQFANQLVEKIRMPLSDLKLGIETYNFRDSSFKYSIQKQMDQMMEVFNELNLPKQLAELGELKPTLTCLPELFDSLNAEIHTHLNEYPISYNYEESYSREWVTVDAVRLKLALQLIFRELLKFLDDSASLQVKVSSASDQLTFHIQVHSILLQEGVEALLRHSLYFSSIQRLIRELSGKIEMITDQLPIHFSIQIPIAEGVTQIPEKSLKNWSHLELLEKIPSGKSVILFYGKQYEADGVLKVFEDENFFLVHERESAMVLSALATLKVNLLIIYHETNLETMELIVKSQHGGRTIPILYLHEHLSERVQEKLLDWGVKDFVQLPTSKVLLQKKVKHLLSAQPQKGEPRKWEGILNLDESEQKLSPNEKLVKEAILLIRAQFEDQSFRVETIYESLGVTKIKLYRAFKEVIQSAPSDLILQMRMEKAVDLLQRSRMNISEVCYECGFNDPKHFSKVFKKYVGASPKRYQLVGEL